MIHGLRLLVRVTPDGVFAGWVVSPANTNEHDLVETLLLVRAAPAAASARVSTLSSDVSVADRSFADLAHETPWASDVSQGILVR